MEGKKLVLLSSRFKPHFVRRDKFLPIEKQMTPPNLPYYFETSRHTPILKEVTYWRHHLFVESESDVCTIILVIGVRCALGLHWLETGGSTLAHTGAGVHEALVI